MKKKIILIASSIVLCLAILLGTIAIINFQQARKQERQREMEAEELSAAFFIQNTAFLYLLHVEETRNWDQRGRYIPAKSSFHHISGIQYTTYAALALFRRLTGSSLTFEQAMEYLSEEFEEDGTIRIYTNGLHPEIAEFVKWIDTTENWTTGDLVIQHLSIFDSIYFHYVRENEPFPRGDLSLLPVEMVDELLRRAEDEDYVMDLTSIQNRYLAEGRARIYTVERYGRDVLQIEFLIPEQ